MKNLLIIGAGYVGKGTAALLAKSPDHRVEIMDINPEVQQKAIADLLLYGAGEEVHAYSGATQYDAVFYCLPTPTTEDGSLDISIVFKEMSDYGRRTKNNCIRSTISPAQAREMDFRTILWPEFLREADWYADAISPSRIVIGGHPSYVQPIENIVSDALAHRMVGVPGSRIPRARIRVHRTGAAEACAIKLASNAFLAAKMAMINELDSWCRNEGMDSSAVIDGVTGDRRIGDSMSRPGLAYGGSCFPKDVLQAAAFMPLFSAVHESNERRFQRWVSLIADEVEGYENDPDLKGILYETHGLELIVRAPHREHVSSPCSRLAEAFPGLDVEWFYAATPSFVLNLKIKTK